VKKVLVPLAPGFEEIEAVTVVDILRRAGAEVFLAGIEDGPILGSRGVRIVPDGPLREVRDREFDLVVLPGGAGGTARLREDSDVARVLERTLGDGRPVAAICAAPTVLHARGLLEDRRIACHPAVAGQMSGARIVEDPVVVDRGVVTSRGAGTALEFALALVELLEGSATRAKVARAIVAAERPPHDSGSKEENR